tara:strand:- start:114 stop:650 length:537 start_codon:yes stop_codon:yes gene_type:complete
MPIGTFGNVADFWRHVNNFPSVDAIHDGTIRINGVPVIAYSLFRKGILPEWEDPVNITGSEWGCRESLDAEQFKVLWQSFIVGAIGEQIAHCVGIRAINKSNRLRHLHKIEVWMDTLDTAAVQECRRSLSNLVQSTPRFSLMPHQEKQHQAFEYQRRRRRGANASVATPAHDDEECKG